MRYPLAPHPTTLSKVTDFVMSNSPWDLLSDEGDIRNETARIAVFEDAAAGNEARIADAAAELAWRRANWRNRLGPPVSRTYVLDAIAQVLFPHHKRSWKRVLLIYGGATALMLLSRKCHSEHIAMPGLFLLALACYLWSAWNALSLLRLKRAIEWSRCPRCGGDLSGHNAIDPAFLDGQLVGPSTCPECGTLWPLIPPPVPTPRQSPHPPAP